jgi:hypothetical protein
MLVSRSLDTLDDAGARTLGTFPLVSGTANFEVLDVPSGAYELFARVPDPTGSGLTGFAWAHVPLDVWDGDVSHITISVNSSVEVKGIVRSSGGVLPSNLRIVFLASDSPSKIPLYRLVATRGTPVEADGSFAASSIPPGRYRLGAISGLPEDFYVSDVRQNAASVFDSGFEVGSRTPGALEIFVSDAAGGVTGSVQDGPLERIAGATVVLIPDSYRLENRALTAIATTTASGQFVFRGVAPGPYRLLAFERIPPNAHQNLGFIRKHENRGHAVEVKPGGMVNVDLTILK